MGHVFISYSRNEFYYAEAVTAVINRSGRTRAWLDVENLRPGTDWAACIDSALDAAGALLLMASPAALRSPYVRAEWTRALAAGIPVHVAVVRGTALPAELAHCPAHDLRVRFWSRSRDLVGELTGDRPGPTATIRRGPAVPSMILLLVAFLCVGIIAAVATGAEIARSAFLERHTRDADFFQALLVGNAVIAGGFVLLLARLSRRRCTPSSLWQGFTALLFTTGAGWLPFALDQDAAIGKYCIASAVAAVAGLALVLWSRTVHLWIPTGTAWHHVRQRIFGRVPRRFKALRRSAGDQWAGYVPKFSALRASSADPGSTAGYRVIHHPADRPIAALIGGACEIAGFTWDEVDARWVFVIVTAHSLADTDSNWEAMTDLRALLGTRVVFVLGTSLTPPADVDADTSVIRRSQWLDFRDQDPGVLYDFLRSTLSRERDSPGPTITPASVERFRGPSYLLRYLSIVQLMVACAVVAPLGLLGADSVSPSRALPLTAVTVLLVTLLLRLAWRTATRLITVEQWQRQAWLIVGVDLLWSGLVLMAEAPLNVLIPVLSTLPVILLRSYRAFRLHWLPPTAVPIDGDEIDPVPPPLVSFLLVLGVAALAPGYVLVA